MKKGFTLAEILITLGIIGVITALTIPGLVASNKKDYYTAALATSVQVVETALNTILTSQSENWLEDTTFFDAFGNGGSATTAAGILGEYLDITGVGTTRTGADADYTGSITGLNGNADNNTLSTGYFFRTKNGALLNFVLTANPTTATNANGLVKQVFTLNIDVNSSTEPNKCGRDIFRFAVDTTGKLYPYGGKDYADYSNTALWSSTDTTYGCNASSLGWGCAGKLFDNGFVMDY